MRKSARFETFEKQWVRRRPPDYFQNLRTFEALFQEARALGAFPLEHPLEGIEVDIRRTKAFHVPTTSDADRPSARD